MNEETLKAIEARDAETAEKAKRGNPWGPDAAEADRSALVAEVRRLREALVANMRWIGPPPKGMHDYDSAREAAWESGVGALGGWPQ